MSRPTVYFLLFIVLLSGIFAFLGLPRIVLAAVLGLLWLILSVVLSFVGDGRYTMAFGDSRPHSTPAALSIGRAALIGELVVNVPAISILAGFTAILGPVFQYAFGHQAFVIGAVVLAFSAAWTWWAVAAPRWLLWAMKRVADPIALRNAVVGSIFWPEGKLGRAFNGTQWRSTAMKQEECRILEVHMRRSRGIGVGSFNGRS